MSSGPMACVTSRASASTAGVERMSSFSRRAEPSPSSLPASRSVAMTRAPSAIKASQMARPIPCPAAVTNATLLSRRWVIFAAFRNLRPLDRPPYLSRRLNDVARGLAALGVDPLPHLVVLDLEGAREMPHQIANQ